MIHVLNSSTSLSFVQDKDIQPNAVDLRLGKVFQIRPTTFVLSETKKVHRGTDPFPIDKDDYWNLPIGTYEIVFQNEIEVGEDEAGWVIPRSTLMRNGIFIVTGLYDSGYAGKMAACLHVTKGNFMVQKGTRIAQYLCFKAESLSQYDGSYGHNSEHDKKYD